MSKVKGKVYSVNISRQKGEKKNSVEQATLVDDWGIRGDAHAGSEIKQVSLLDKREIDKMSSSVDLRLYPGDFAENFTTTHVELDDVEVGQQILLGDKVILEVSQIGKKCHEGCVIKQKTGKCVMPSKGVFCRVVKGGKVKKDDTLWLKGDPALDS